MKKTTPKKLQLTTNTIRHLDRLELAVGAGPTAETMFLTVCAPCKTFPCPVGTRACTQ